MKLVSKSRMTYGTRRLAAGDEFDATHSHGRVLLALGKATVPGRAKKAVKVPHHDEISLLRAEYERVYGKKPFGAWKEDKLREKIAEAAES